MPNPFPVSDAAIRAIQGGSDVNNLLRALHDDRMARIVALAPDAHRVIRAVAALSGGMTALLDESDIADPALHDTLARLIGTQDMRNAFRWWATIAPAGWGRAYADALVDGALQDMDSPRAIAALIEPSNAAAALVTKANDMAWVIRRWGQSTPDTPTAWMHSLSSRERNRLLHAVRQFSFAAASCLPWLPPNRANQGESAIGDLADLTGAINAFVIASPYARAHHTSLVQRLVARAYPAHLGELTHLACAIYSDEVGMQALARAHDHPFAGHRGFASFVRRLVARAHLVYPGAIARQTCGIGSEDVWNRVRMLIHESPDDAWRVVTAAPWDDLAETARAVILECANRSDTCAAVAAARGRKRTGRITPYSAVAFFAALDPKVWDEIPSDEQRRWRDALPDDAAHLAVRSLGLRPEFLARAWLDNTLVHAARRHARRASVLCWRLLPVALHDIPLDAVHAIMTVLPTPPPEPGVFFVTAGRHSSPSVIAIAHTALREPSDLARAVVLQRGALSQQFIRDRCTALQEALRGRSWKDMESIAPLLDVAARSVLMPDPDVLIRRLAHPDRTKEMRQALANLANLPLEIAIPTFVALNQPKPWRVSNPAEVIANVLRNYGDIFLALVDALTDDLRTVLLPLPEQSAMVNALRDVARDDPTTAQRLAYAFRTHDHHGALHVLQTAPSYHVAAICGAMDAADLRAAVDVLVERPDVLRAIWSALSQEVRQSLRVYPAFSDLSMTDDHLDTRSLRR